MKQNTATQPRFQLLLYAVATLVTLMTTVFVFFYFYESYQELKQRHEVERKNKLMALAYHLQEVYVEQDPSRWKEEADLHLSHYPFVSMLAFYEQENNDFSLKKPAKAALAGNKSPKDLFQQAKTPQFLSLATATHAYVLPVFQKGQWQGSMVLQFSTKDMNRLVWERFLTDFRQKGVWVMLFLVLLIGVVVYAVVIINAYYQSLTEKLGKIRTILAEISRFIAALAAGNFKAKLSVEKGVVTDKVIKSLEQTKRALLQKDRKEKEERFIVDGKAKVADILRENDDLSRLGNQVLKVMVEHLSFSQGAFYVVNRFEKKPTIVLFSLYAYQRKKFLQKTFYPGEGLVGQAFLEKAPIYRTELPEDYLTIPSGVLGELKPKALFIQPLLVNEQVVGVLEFAHFTPFTAWQRKAIGRVAESIGQSIFNIQSNNRNKKLLLESQELANVLQKQKQQLMDNAQELKKTKEALEASNKALQKKVEEVTAAQDRIDAFMENASEMVLIFDEYQKLVYQSPSLSNITLFPKAEIQQKHFYGLLDDNSAQGFERILSNLPQKSSDDFMTTNLSLEKANGEKLFLEIKARNRLDDLSIRGLMVNMLDVSERLLIEQEKQKRGQMQALSENSPDIIMRLSVDGTVNYVNPIIQGYTGLEPEDIMDKNITAVTMDEQLVEHYLQMMNDAIATEEVQEAEVTIDTQIGERIMNVNAIPEFGMEGVQTVLTVSHDITEEKQIAIELSDKNEKITESINYAKRIQDAIIPSLQIFKKTFPDAFLMFKPKDVVSGDFPWFYATESHQYFAAVDCTGHGVPGALMSLIGYAILNQSLQQNQEIESHELLNRLHREVRSMLRQDRPDARTKDGMDLAMVRVDYEKMQLDFSGARRPLLMCKAGGEVIEYKADRISIGGSPPRRGPDEFTHEVIPFEKGDMIYLFSDGLQDQFGGPKLRKFSPKRIRSIAAENHEESMDYIGEAFENALAAWKGDEAQIDDILLIGVRL